MNSFCTDYGKRWSAFWVAKVVHVALIPFMYITFLILVSLIFLTICHRSCTVVEVRQVWRAAMISWLLNHKLLFLVVWVAAMYMGLCLDLIKYSGLTPVNDMVSQIITSCAKFTMELNQPGICAFFIFLQILWPWFSN